MSKKSRRRKTHRNPRRKLAVGAMWRVKMKHDKGVINIDTWGMTGEGAVRKILIAERAPRSAVKSVRKITANPRWKRNKSKKRSYLRRRR